MHLLVIPKQVAGFFEKGNKPSRSIQVGYVHDKLRNYQLLNKAYVP
jgi:hypothetical protein